MSTLSACRRRVTLVVLLLAATGAAQADTVGGDCRTKDETSAVVDGLVFTQPNVFEASKTDTVVALSTIKLDKAALAKISDGAMKESALRRQLMEDRAARLVKLTIESGTVTALNFNGGGTSYSTSGTQVGELSAKVNDSKQIEASFSLPGEPDELRCELRFKLAYGSTASASGGASAATAAAAAPAAAGKALPAGGGEPGKVFQANVAAMQKGDIDAMLATVSKAQADKMRERRNDPKFPAMLQMMKSFAPKSATVTGGQDFGDRAELTIDAVDQSGAKSSGTCKLVKEDGQWKVEKTSMKSGS